MIIDPNHWKQQNVNNSDLPEIYTDDPLTDIIALIWAALKANPAAPFMLLQGLGKRVLGSRQRRSSNSKLRAARRSVRQNNNSTLNGKTAPVVGAA